MVSNFAIASVADAEIYNLNGDFLVNGNMLTDSNINFTATENTITAGFMNKLLARYLSDAKLDFELTSVAFNLESIALNIGGDIEVGANCQTVETVECITNGELVVTQEPQLFANIKNKIAWVSKVGENDFVKYDFDLVNTKKISIADVKVGEKYCVKYMVQDASAQQLTVSTAFMPKMVSALLKLPLLKLGTKGMSTSTRVGTVEIEVPLAQFNGTNLALTLSATGNATVPLSFTALDSGEVTSCGDTTGSYAKIKQIVFDTDEFEGVRNIVVEDSDIDLTVGDKQIIRVYAMYGGLKAPKLLDNSKLTFTSSADTYATVGQHTGEVEALAEGTSIIDVVVTDHSELVAKAVVEVNV